MEQRDTISSFTNKENLKIAERRLTDAYLATVLRTSAQIRPIGLTSDMRQPVI